MIIQSTETVAGIAIPDTALVREATAHIRSAEDDVLFHHSRRVYLFGVLHGRRSASKQTWNCFMWRRCSTTSA